MFEFVMFYFFYFELMFWEGVLNKKFCLVCVGGVLELCVFWILWCIVDDYYYMYDDYCVRWCSC